MCLQFADVVALERIRSHGNHQPVKIASILAVIWASLWNAMAADQVTVHPSHPHGEPPKWGTFYSAKHPALPPLPFNPFPGSKVIDAGNNRYVVDDVSPSSQQTPQTLGFSSPVVPGTPPSTNQPPQPPPTEVPLASGVSWLRIIKEASDSYKITIRSAVERLGFYHQVLFKDDLNGPWTGCTSPMVIPNTTEVVVLSDIDGNAPPKRFYRGAAATRTIRIRSLDNLAQEPRQNVQESGDPGAFIIERARALPPNSVPELHVPYRLSGHGISGVDYELRINNVPISGSITVPQGVQSVRVDLIPLADSQVDVDQDVVIHLGLDESGDPDVSYVIENATARIRIIEPIILDDVTTQTVPVDIVDGMWSPCGIDYDGSGALTVSYFNPPNTDPRSFCKIRNPVGSGPAIVEAWSAPFNLWDETKFVVVKTPFADFAPGSVVFGGWIAGGGLMGIGYIDQNGNHDPSNDWMQTSGEHFRGGFCQDSTGIFSYAILAVSSESVTSSTAPALYKLSNRHTRVRINYDDIPTSHCEGLCVVPNLNRYGCIAGTAVTGDEIDSRLIAITPSGELGLLSIPYRPEDFDLVPNPADSTQYHLYATDMEMGQLKVRRLDWTNLSSYRNDILVSQSNEWPKNSDGTSGGTSRLAILRWDASAQTLRFTRLNFPGIVSLGELEGVTFAPITINSAN